MKKLEINNYNKFKCIADKCKYTCCEGWDINIDEDTFDKWTESKNNIFKNRVVHGDDGLIIDKDVKEACTFLECNGLCKIVKSLGDEYISKTCRSFPRIINEFDERIECSLSLSCLEVIRIIDKFGFDINEMSCKFEKYNEDYIKVRKVLLEIMDIKEIDIEDKLLVSYKMLLDILETEDIREISQYKNSEYIIEMSKVINELDSDKEGGIEELNSLFLDIIDNYKEVPLFKNILEDISIFSEEIDPLEIIEELKDFKNELKIYDKLILDCIKSKIISLFISDDCEENIITFQLIILEYILMKHSLLLMWINNKDKTINKENVMDYIMLFSRIIGNNSEAVVQFIEDGFDSEILDFGYLSYITSI